MKAKKTSIVIAIIGIIAIIAVMFDYISFTVVPDDDLVEEPFEEPCNEPSGTRTPPTPDVSPSHAPSPHKSQRGFRVLDTWNIITGSITIRYGSFCICSLARNMLIMEIIVIFLIIVIIVIKII